MNTQQPVRNRICLALTAGIVPSILFTTSVLAQGGRYASEQAWTFAVTADTQWTITHSLDTDSDDPYYARVNPNYREENPNYVSVATLLRLNEEFIDHEVDFVVQLGDLTDRAGNAAMFTHAQARQPLYEAGIGFFPVRGNHETYGNLYGLDPDPADPDQDAPDMNIPAWHEAFPQTRGEGDNLAGAYNFNGPDIEALEGLSYSFDVGPAGSDARFVFMDIEPTSYWLDIPPPHEEYGQPYIFTNTFSWTVYQHTEALVAREGNVILPGTWFRLASNGEPSTEFYGNAPADDAVLEPDMGGFTYDGTQYRPGDQQDWIDNRLQDPDRPVHAFVLSHRNLMGQNHRDVVWGDNPSLLQDDQNAFYRSLQENGAGYFLSAHDHMHHRSVLQSPDGNWQVEQLIASSSDPKFYTPNSGTMSGQRWRESPVSQELDNIGYYIFTVDGARVNVDYYSDQVGGFGTDYCWPDGIPAPEASGCSDPRFGSSPPEVIGSFYLPSFRFVKKENWGYGRNGQRFVVPQGVSYAGDTIEDGDEILTYPRVEDSFGDTHAAILHGFNASIATDNIPEEPRALFKSVTTAWTKNPDGHKLKSDILSLWGMAELGNEETDEYVLSLSFDYRRMIGLGAGAIGIATYVDGQWVNAVDQNFGGSKDFVVGPYVEGEHPLGTYGVDPASKTAWAVLNYNADFAVANGIEKLPGSNGIPPQVVEAISFIQRHIANVVRLLMVLFGH